MLLVDAQPGEKASVATNRQTASRADARERGPRPTEFSWLARAMTNADPWRACATIRGQVSVLCVVGPDGVRRVRKLV